MSPPPDAAPTTTSVARTTPLAIVKDPANLLSLSRLLLAALVWVRPADVRLLVALLAAAAITDWLDGWVGRHRRVHRTGIDDVGAWLDPVCDKVFVVSAAVAVFVVHDPPVLLVLVLLVRDLATPVLVVALRAVFGADAFYGHDYRARWSGKATTVAQFATIAAIVFAPSWAWPLAGVTGALGVFAVAHRVVIALRERRITRSGS